MQLKADKAIQEELIAIANVVADAAREAILPHFRRRGLDVEDKGQDAWDPVTAADRAAELAMRRVLELRRPNDSIVGEEYPDKVGNSGLTWVLDPIDGTGAFVCGSPTWGVLVAAADYTGPILGIIDQPFIGERFVGGLGRAETTGPLGLQALRTRDVSCLERAALFTTLPEIGDEFESNAFRHLATRVQNVRYGLDCYAYALLAAGHIDLVVEAGLKPVDIYAPIAVVQAAGGIVTDWERGPAHRSQRVVAAASAKLHDAALEFLASRPKS